MIDVSNLDDLFQMYELMLHKELLQMFSTIAIDNVQMEGEIHLNSTLIDVAKYYQSLENFEREYEDRKRIAPNWEVALTKWINEIENEILGVGQVKVFDELSGSYYYTENFKKPLAVQAFNDITEGKNRYLYTYARIMVRGTDENQYINPYEIPTIGLGVAIAYKLPKLKEELKQIQDFGTITPQELQPIKQRINWSGTAGEFAAIIDVLIEKGYIEEILLKNNKARLFLDTFNIKNQKNGQPITERTLIECFGKDKHNFLPNDFKIVPSINYGKEQLPAQKQNGNRTGKED